MTTVIDNQENMELESDDNSSLQAPGDTFEPAILFDHTSIQPYPGSSPTAGTALSTTKGSMHRNMSGVNADILADRTAG